MRRYQVVPIMEENEDDDEDAAAFFRVSFFPFFLLSNMNIKQLNKKCEKNESNDALDQLEFEIVPKVNRKSTLLDPPSQKRAN